MTHKFKDEIINWLNGCKYEFTTSTDDAWFPVYMLNAFDVASEVRKIDEYKHLREALARGETIQAAGCGGLGLCDWFDLGVEPAFTRKAEFYRIKPKTKKMVQWLLQLANGDFVSSTYFMPVGTRPIDYEGKPIKPLPHTEIEVEE